MKDKSYHYINNIQDTLQLALKDLEAEDSYKIKGSLARNIHILLSYCELNINWLLDEEEKEYE